MLLSTRSRPLSDPSQSRESFVAPLPETSRSSSSRSGRVSPIVNRKGSQSSFKSVRSTTPQDMLERSDSEKSSGSRPSLRRFGSATKLFFGGSYRSQNEDDGSGSEASFVCISARAIERAARAPQLEKNDSPIEKPLPPLPTDLNPSLEVEDQAARAARGRAQDLVLRHLDLDKNGPLPPGLETPRQLMLLAVSEQHIELFARYFEFEDDINLLGQEKYRLAKIGSSRPFGLSPKIIERRQGLLHSLSAFYSGLQRSEDGDTKLLRVLRCTVAQPFRLSPSPPDFAPMDHHDLGQMLKLGVMSMSSREKLRTLLESE